MKARTLGLLRFLFLSSRVGSKIWKEKRTKNRKAANRSRDQKIGYLRNKEGPRTVCATSFCSRKIREGALAVHPSRNDRNTLNNFTCFKKYWYTQTMINVKLLTFKYSACCLRRCTEMSSSDTAHAVSGWARSLTRISGQLAVCTREDPPEWGCFFLRLWRRRQARKTDQKASSLNATKSRIWDSIYKKCLQNQSCFAA